MRADQKDSDSLPPYDVLDTILEDFVEESRSAEEIARVHNFDPDLVRRVIRMVERSEYKRQQAAPGIKISAKAFGYGRKVPDRRESGGMSNPYYGESRILYELSSRAKRGICMLRRTADPSLRLG